MRTASVTSRPAAAGMNSLDCNLGPGGDSASGADRLPPSLVSVGECIDPAATASRPLVWARQRGVERRLLPSAPRESWDPAATASRPLDRARQRVVACRPLLSGTRIWSEQCGGPPWSCADHWVRQPDRLVGLARGRRVSARRAPARPSVCGGVLGKRVCATPQRERNITRAGLQALS